MKLAEKRRVFAQRIVEWHRTNSRKLPWRSTLDPYAILVSEILLRRTAARQVAKVYELFMGKYPTPSALAQASPKEVEEVIGSLGLKGKAKHLKDIALRIENQHGGEVPSNAKELLDFPGVGRYAANAVLCFAFRKDLPVVDGSIIRVMRRVFSLVASTYSPHRDPAIWSFAAKMIPPARAREFNWGLLDFAAEICAARNPKHEVCFLRDVCDYYRARVGRIKARNTLF